ncbi:MAG: protein-tyrosine-phosphatase [Robiginitomaculum sp.]|nr:MAG: protein-tyrosine-phosphatase [Robiginitomaculum sp.]
MRHRILFVCLGNICRSPSAEAVLRYQAGQQGLSLEVGSAGTGNWHVGQAPDARAMSAAAGRGIDMQNLRARQVSVADFTRFTHIFAMDQSNLADLQAMRPEGGIMPALFLGPASNTPPGDVPDPYYGGAQGFEHMLDLIEAAAEGFLETLS